MNNDNCECTALIDTGANINFMSLSVVNHLGWALSTAEPIKVRFANRECLHSIGQSARLVLVGPWEGPI